jgi:hypothetical protein
MTPKEKAEELVRKYYSFGINKEGQTLSWYECKQCALIAVDEIILSRKNDSQFDDTLWAGGSDMYTMHPMYLNYWQEVKKEIELL